MSDSVQPGIQPGMALLALHDDIRMTSAQLRILDQFKRAVMQVLATGKYPELEADISVELKAIGEEHGQ